LATAVRGYQVLAPQPGWAEQDPDEWWRSTCEVLRECRAALPSHTVDGVSISGQMHGTVLVDNADEAIRPAIIWADQRSAAECDAFVARVGKEWLAERTANPLAAGFQLATLLWLAKHEANNLRRAAKVLLPKDYVRGRMTGVWATEPSDACSTLAFDTARCSWSDDVIEAAGIARDIFPECYESLDRAGDVTADAASATGLPAGTPVFTGGGDAPMTALGNGVLNAWHCMATIGSGGQLLAPIAAANYDTGLRTHTFRHIVRDRWYVMGAILSAGLSLKWLREQVLGANAPDYATLSEMADRVPVGAEGLVFLPYLTGERTPHMNPNACGMFFGLTPRHTSAHMVRAVMEGVAFALADGLDIMRSLGIVPKTILAAGGGARSPLWRQIQADVFACPVVACAKGERAAYGAALLASVGIGWWNSLDDACEAWIEPAINEVYPNIENMAKYQDLRQIFTGTYAATAELMEKRSQFIQT
jgi:xylulokinase